MAHKRARTDENPSDATPLDCLRAYNEDKMRAAPDAEMSTAFLRLDKQYQETLFEVEQRYAAFQNLYTTRAELQTAENLVKFNELQSTVMTMRQTVHDYAAELQIFRARQAKQLRS